MILVHQAGAALLLVTLTLWLQSVGLATLAAWAKRAMARGLHQLDLLHSARLVVRLTAAVVALQGLQILLWASCYRWLCLPSWGSALYFSASSYTTVGFGDVVLAPKWRMLGPLESIMGVLMCGISVSLLFAVLARLVGRQES